jgi:hypothetical protein
MDVWEVSSNIVTYVQHVQLGTFSLGMARILLQLVDG